MNNSETANLVALKLDNSKQEAEWIEAAKARDVVAFKSLYSMHMPMVFALCSRLCVDDAIAQDATQEVFIQVWNKLSNYKGESKFSTWLHTVATRVTISYLRKQRDWWKKMIDIDDDSSVVNVATTQLEHIDLDSLIRRLPNRARWVFVLHAIEGYRHDQIASMLDIAVGTSKAQYHRARHLIEEWVDEH